MPRTLLIVNPRSGAGADAAEALVAAARERDVGTHVLRPGDDAAAIARANDVEILGVAGGDGSLAAVAEVAVERRLGFVCVPTGTRNHLARDLGLDRDDPVAALAAFANGIERRMDVGRLNGRLFLNNVSLGMYATLVHRRERHRRRSETFARLRAIAAVSANRQPSRLRLTIDGKPVEASVVLVANNAYRLEPLSLGERPRLDAGELHLYALSGLVRSSWDDSSGTAFTIACGTDRLPAAVDGEAALLDAPVEFRIEPLALRALVPRRPE